MEISKESYVLHLFRAHLPHPEALTRGHEIHKFERGIFPNPYYVLSSCA